MTLYDLRQRERKAKKMEANVPESQAQVLFDWSDEESYSDEEESGSDSPAMSESDTAYT